MASTSSSSMASQEQHQAKKYDVFVSFRGEDIRWCLQEVVEIIRCWERMGQMVVPVFYHVDPSHVRKQSGKFAKAFAGHKKIHNKEKVEEWRSALTKAGSLLGWHQASATSSENELVEDIVGAVLKKLIQKSSSDTESLIGMDSHIKQMESLLCASVWKADVYLRTVGIWGMGGMGKTTVVEVIFRRISSQFEGCCFLANVREEWEKYGRTHLQGKLLSAIFGDENLNKVSSNMGCNTFIRDRLRRSKVLIVLDDVDSLEQLEFLVGECDGFGLGSRVIITSRNKQVLKRRVDKIYEITALSDPDALRLFNRYAFKSNHPTEGFEDLSSRVVKYANGNPLALKVIGSALLYKSKKVWESALNKLEKSLPDEIQGKLRISYDGLGKEEKNIFLDIACFFKGDNEDDVTRILDGCGFHTQFGLSVLVDKSLIFVQENHIWMHDLLQQMGRAIVSDESQQPSKRSRFWIPKEAADILRKNKGTKNVEGIILDLSGLNDVHFPAKTFERMKKLRVLKILIGCKVHLPHGLECLPEELRCLWWHEYPLKSLPFNFDPENLVDLDLRYSDIQELWNGVQDLPNLKFIDLSHSGRLINIPDFSAAPNLMRIRLKGCTGLLDVHPSIWALDNLTELNLRNCKKIRSFPESIHLKSLKTLILSGCLNLIKFPEILEKMECLEELALSETAIEKVPSSIDNLIGLVTLDLKNCHRLQSLPELPPSIVKVVAHNCTRLKTVTFSSELSVNTWLNYRFFNFTNCLELDQEQRINIQEEALRLIKLIATPSLELRHQCGTQYRLHSVLVPESEFVVPESEFVEWFDNQSMGSSVTVQLPPDWFKCSFMEFSICALLECNGLIPKRTDIIECKCTFNNEFGNKSFDFRLNDISMFGGRLLMSDHLFLGYGALVMDEWPNKCYPTEASFQFSSRYKVKKCGVHLVCPPDKKDNNPMEQTSSSKNFGEPMLEDTNVKDFHDDCSKEPNPKRLKRLEFH